MAAKKNNNNNKQIRTGQMPVQRVNIQKIPPKKLTKLERQARREAAQSIRVAATCGPTGGIGGGGFGGYGNADISLANSNFYSPQLSTDFLELPQSEREKRELFRFWYSCFPPGAPVQLADGTTKSIEDIEIGDEVPNGFGEITKVKELFRQDIKDSIVRMKVRGVQNHILCTGNHPFLVYRADQINCKYEYLGACKQDTKKICERVKCKSKDFRNPEFVYSKDLREGDFIVGPPLKDQKDCNLSRAQLRLLGYYASEGSVEYRADGVIRGVEYNLGITEEQTLAQEIYDLFLEVYNKKARIYPNPERSTIKVVCDSVEFADFCVKHCGSLSREKKLSKELLYALPEQQLEFLGAYWNGDGCFTDNSYTADSMSSFMSQQLFLMLRRVGIPAYHNQYFRKERIIDNRVFPSGIIHYISFSGRFHEFFSLYANFVKGEYTTTSTRVYQIVHEGVVLHRVESLEKVDYEGPVFNFEVEGDGDKKSYIAYGLATHNTHPIVGASIDFHCFPLGAPVTLKDGSVSPIESLKIGDKILNGFGEPTKVVQTFQHDIDGPITRLKVRGVQDIIDCTENHPFLVYRAKQIDCKYRQHGIGACKNGTKFICKQKKCVGINVGEPEFVFAKDLRVGDYICSPSIMSSNRVFNRAQLRLLGYYTAEGSLSYTMYGKLDRVVFSLSIDKFNTIAEEISQLFNDEYDHRARKHVIKDHNSCQVRCYKKIFAEFCYAHVGSNSRYKKLSLDIINSPREDILEFLGAYWNGDGSLTKNGYVATTASKQLAYQIYALALKVGYAPTLHFNAPKNVSTGFKSNGIYQIIIPYHFHAEFSKYANFVQNGYQASSTREYCVQINNNTLRRIEKVDTIHYQGKVYNIEVNGKGNRKSYIAYGLATHNTDVPMSKIRLSLPKGKDHKKNKQILHFYQEMCKRIHLFQVLYDATHEYWLHGNCYIFCEDQDMAPELPESIFVKETEEEIGEIDQFGNPSTRKEKKLVKKTDKEQTNSIYEYIAKNYNGWQRLQILPPEQVKLEVFQYTNKVKMELIPSEKDRLVVLKAETEYDSEAKRIADDIPEQIKENLLSGQPIPLNTSPYDDYVCSSFCYHLSHKKSAYDDRGISILERCHLPGTEITARRDDQILQIPIEDLDPETDLVLGGSGEWREFQWGTRSVLEEVTEIHVEKVLDSVRMTSDHKMQVLRDDTTIDITAGEICPGDYVAASRIRLSETVCQVDFAEFVRAWNGGVYIGRKSGNSSFLRMSVVDENQDEFFVQYIKKETDSRRSNYYNKLEAVLDWLSGLDEPVKLSGPELCERFGFYLSDKTKVRADLVELGVLLKVEYDGATFQPFRGVTVIDKSSNIIKRFKRRILFDSDMGYLVGYWLGDGWIKRNGSTLDYGQFGICYSLKSPRSCASAIEVKRILDKIGVKWSEIVYGINCTMVTIVGYNDIFTRWFGVNFGHTSKDKHLPTWVFDAPKEFLLGLIRGLIDSDGCVTVKKTGVTTVQLAMSTKPLIDQVVLLMQSLGFPASVYLHKSRDIRMPNGTVTKDCKLLWQVAFSDTKAVQALMTSGFLAKRVEVRIPEHLGWGQKHKIINNELWYRVKAVVSIPYDGPVYSLNVEEDHTFYSGRIRSANCLRTLLFQDKLRQAQTSIASRAMTPKRIVWADKMSQTDVEDLRDQVDQALIDPDFTIITNFELHWDEIGSRDRLLDLGTEYEITNKLLFIGLRITESMLTGESTYSGERIHLDVMNTMYLLYRENIATMVEEQLFAPVAEKKGFWEIDEYGNRILLFPKLQFTRLALRDNAELQDFMFNLYAKGSLPISYIYEILNIDVDDAHAELKKDVFTLKDSQMNELIRGLLSSAGDKVLSETNVLNRIIDSLGLKHEKSENDRFGKD